MNLKQITTTAVQPICKRCLYANDEEFLNDFDLLSAAIRRVSVCKIDSRGLNYADFKYCYPKNIPQQPNGFDCGIYCCDFIFYSIFGDLLRFDYSSEYKRRKLNEKNADETFDSNETWNCQRNRSNRYNRASPISMPSLRVRLNLIKQNSLTNFKFVNLFRRLN